MESIENKSQLSQFFANKNVLLTGGAGFLGKLLIEKLLRSTKVKKIYLILRQKGDKGPEERLEEILKNVVSLIIIIFLRYMCIQCMFVLVVRSS